MNKTSLALQDIGPRLPQLLGSTEESRLHSRLRDRMDLQRLLRQADEDRQELAASAAWLTEQQGRPAPRDMDRDLLSQLAREAQEKEQEAVAHFVPVIESLKRELGPPTDGFEADVQRLLQDGIEVLEGWLAFYHDLYMMLARQTGERDHARRLLRARPVQREIDHAELTREIIRRFPNILAELAK